MVVDASPPKVNGRGVAIVAPLVRSAMLARPIRRQHKALPDFWRESQFAENGGETTLNLLVVGSIPTGLTSLRSRDLKPKRELRLGKPREGCPAEAAPPRRRTSYATPPTNPLRNSSRTRRQLLHAGANFTRPNSFRTGTRIGLVLPSLSHQYLRRHIRRSLL